MTRTQPDSFDYSIPSMPTFVNLEAADFDLSETI